MPKKNEGNPFGPETDIVTTTDVPDSPFGPPTDHVTPTDTTPENPFDIKPKDPTKPPDTPTTPTNLVKPLDPVERAKQEAIDGKGSALPINPSALDQAANQLYPLPQVSLQLKALDQKELREFTAEYSSRKATQRTYRPQGFFGLSEEVLQKLPKGAFLEVDTNSEFWRRYEVTVHGPLPEDYEKLGLTTAVVQIDYGDPAGGTRHVNKSFGFNAPAAAGTTQRFSTPMYSGYADYGYRLTYAFDSSWTGARAQRELDEVRSTVRDVFVLPQRDFKFVVVNAAFTSPPDWTKFSQIHVYLTCSSLSATIPESFDRTVVIHEGWMPSLAATSTPQRDTDPQLPWRLRFQDASTKTPVRIAYRVKYVTRDGRELETAAKDTSDPTLILEPAPRA